MMELKEAFLFAKDNIEKLSVAPANDELLQLYALFKQATIGNNNVEEPGNFDFKAHAKFEAWRKLEGMDNETAMTRYIDLANSLLKKYN